MGCHFLLQGICPTQRSNLDLLHCRQILYHVSIRKALTNFYFHYYYISSTSEHQALDPRGWLLLLLLSHFSRVRLCATPQMAAHQALPSLGFSRQEHWSGLPLPSLPRSWDPCYRWPGKLGGIQYGWVTLWTVICRFLLHGIH